MGLFVSKNNSAYIIAEVGQNHQGDYQIALDYVDKLASVGVDAVKFQMRSNKNLFSPEKLDQPYDNQNAFGTTYGEHREKLELSFDEMSRLRDSAVRKGMDFICTPFDEVSLSKLLDLDIYSREMQEMNIGTMERIQYHHHKTVVIDT